MAVYLRLLDENMNTLASIDKGLVRLGTYTITKFIIENTGSNDAKEVIISSTPNTSEGTLDYENQVRAAAWKTFSFEEDGEYVDQLEIGDIPAGGYSQGILKTPLNLASPELFLFKDVWNTGINTFGNGRFTFSKLEGQSDGQIGKKMDCMAISQCRNFEVEFKFDISFIAEGASGSLPFFAFPCRMNSKGDGKGYYFMVRINRNTKKYRILVYKGAMGMTTNVDRDYGAKYIETLNEYDLNPNTLISLKCHNDKLGNPYFEVRLDGERVMLQRAYSDTKGYSITDYQADRYTGYGNFFFEISMYAGDINMTFSDMTLKTEDTQKFLYVKSSIPNDANSNITYTSAINLSYLEV